MAITGLGKNQLISYGFYQRKGKLSGAMLLTQRIFFGNQTHGQNISEYFFMNDWFFDNFWRIDPYGVSGFFGA